MSGSCRLAQDDQRSVPSARARTSAERKRNEAAEAEEEEEVALVIELLQRREGGGAVAVWAPTGLAQPEGHAALFTALYQALFTRDLTTLGASTAAAKIEAYGISTAWGELAETYVLFGDPASRLTQTLTVNAKYRALAGRQFAQSVGKTMTAGLE